MAVNQKNISLSDLGVSLDYAGLPMQTEEVLSYMPVQSNLDTENSQKLVGLYLKPSIYKKTNLSSAVFSLYASKNIDNESACYMVKGVTLNQERKVFGNFWKYNQSLQGSGSSAMMQNSFNEIYRLYKNKVCYEALLTLNDFEISAVDEKKAKYIQKYSYKKVMNRLGKVFNRLKIK